MLLTQGIFGKEFDIKKKPPFGLFTGQMKGRPFCHNSGWYNKNGEKLGWGDLDTKDIVKISKKIPENELFFILSERDSFWNFVTQVGIIGSMCVTAPTEQAPGIDYVLEKFIYLIGKDKIYCTDRNRSDFEWQGVKFEAISVEAVKGLILETVLID